MKSLNLFNNHTYENLKVENLKFKSPIPGQTWYDFK